MFNSVLILKVFLLFDGRVSGSNVKLRNGERHDGNGIFKFFLFINFNIHIPSQLIIIKIKKNITNHKDHMYMYTKDTQNILLRKVSYKNRSYNLNIDNNKIIIIANNN